MTAGQIVTWPLLAIARATVTVAQIVARRRWLGVVAFFVFLALVGFFAPAQADDGPAPTGFGDLLGGPDLRGEFQPTLYEAYNMGSYYFDTNRLNSAADAHHIILNGLASVIMLLTAAIIRGAIVIVWTMFDDTSSQGLADSITPNIAATAGALLPWVLPAALALGAVIAYARQRGTGGGGLSQIAWVFAGGILAVSFATSPGMWVDNMTDIRSAAAEGVMSAASSSVATTNTPFEFPAATYDGDPQNTMMRDSADAIWRSYVVTPWCLANFGSKTLCERYGKAMLDQGMNPSTRSDWIQNSDEAHPGEYNSDGAAYRWIAGKNSYERLGMALVAFIVGVIFAALVFVVAFASQIAFYGALLMLFVGVLFAMLWCIPGKPREWANKWLETVIGLMIQSVVGALVLAATLSLTSRAFELAGDAGWGVAAGLSIGVTVAAFSMRRTISTILGAMTPGMGMTTVIGALAVRGGAKMMGRGMRGLASVTGRGAAAAAGGAARGIGRGASAAGKGARAGWGNYRSEVARKTGERRGESVPATSTKPGRDIPQNPTTTRPPGGRPGNAPDQRSSQPSRPGAPRPDGAGRPSRSAPSVGRPQLRNNPPGRRRSGTTARPSAPRPAVTGSEPRPARSAPRSTTRAPSASQKEPRPARRPTSTPPPSAPSPWAPGTRPARQAPTRSQEPARAPQPVQRRESAPKPPRQSPAPRQNPPRRREP